MPLIAFDGMDGSGKSTHLDLATQTYQRLFPDEKPPIIIHHPAHTGLGRTVRDLLHVNKVRFNPHVEAYLYAADLVQQLLDVVDPAEDAGRIVFAHRWLVTALVYRFVDGIDRDYAIELYKQVCSIPNTNLVLCPDINLVFLTDPTEVCKRVEARETTSVSPYENLEAAMRVHAEFHTYGQFANTSAHFGPNHYIDTTFRDIFVTHLEVMRQIGNRLDNVHNNIIKRYANNLTEPQFLDFFPSVKDT